jgi:putative membrane protein
MMGWYGGGAGPLQWLGMGVFWLVVLALIVLLVVRLLPGTGAPTRTVGRSALEILERRLASGEIDQRTWQTRRAVPLAAGPDKV